VALVEATVGPLRHRGNGTAVGNCFGHGSKSGACLVVWPAEGRWWCSSCRRGGDATAWVALTEGISYAQARQRLGLTPTPCPAGPKRRPSGRPLPQDWRPAAGHTLPADWRPDQPLPWDPDGRP
jgi:hypothetical protein